MQNTLKKYADRGVVWLAIDSTSSLDAESNRVYTARKGLAYPILNDPTGRVGHKYDAKTTPHMFVIDKAGTLVYTGAIDGEQDGKADQNYVADALDAVLSGSTVARSKTKPYGCGIKYAN
jgi:peroxiredoxin